VKAVKRKKTKVQNKELRPQNLYSFSSMSAKQQGPGEAQPILPPLSLGMLLCFEGTQVQTQLNRS